MTEIDDNYDANVETLDQRFFEEIEKGTDRKTALTTYLKKLDVLRHKREEAYKTYVTKRKKEIWKKKKKKQKKEAFKHLEVEHFEFEFNFFERLWQQIDITWFRFKRFILSTFWSITPRFLIHRYYSFMKETKDLRETISSFIEKQKIRIEKFFTRRGIRLWAFLKKWGLKIGEWLKIGFSKVQFWKKKGGGEQKEGGREGEAEKKEGESKETPPEESTKQEGKESS